MTRKDMLTVRELLFATDFSPCSDAAVQVARECARRFSARLHILHVLWAGADRTMPPLLNKLADELGGDVPVVTAVESGAPAEQIVRYAVRHGIDLIVVGTHGRTGFTRALLGSVAERVARTAPCPVLTVPAGLRGTVPVEAPELPTGLRCCIICARESEDLICEPCRARIRGEALEHKLREERAGRS